MTLIFILVAVAGLQPVCRLLGDKPGLEMPIGLYRDLAVGVAEGGAEPGATVNCIA